MLERLQVAQELTNNLNLNVKHPSSDLTDSSYERAPNLTLGETEVESVETQSFIGKRNSRSDDEFPEQAFRPVKKLKDAGYSRAFQSICDDLKSEGVAMRIFGCKV